MRNLSGAAGVLALAIGVVWGVSGVMAADQHGIGFSKGCNGPTNIGSPYTCSYTITNNQDNPAHDTLTITSIVDVVHAAGGDVTSGNLLDLTGATLVLSGGATCGAGKCTLPNGASIATSDLSFYNVVAADYNKNPVTHALTDTATLTWQDLCDKGSTNCPVGDQSASSGSQTTVTKLTPTVVTAIHAGAGAADTAGAGAITSAAIGSTVHDKATVTGGAGTPTGDVDFTVYLGNTTCQGTGTAAGTAVALVSGVAHPSNDATVPAGGISYIAHYNGDATYTGKDGDCEALTAEKLTPTVVTAMSYRCRCG